MECINKEDLIELVQPVYGLDDAPLRWHETVTRYLRSMGMQKSLLDPCIYHRHDASGDLELLILIEVDDFVIQRLGVRDLALLLPCHQFALGHEALVPVLDLNIIVDQVPVKDLEPLDLSNALGHG